MWELLISFSAGLWTADVLLGQAEIAFFFKKNVANLALCYETSKVTNNKWNNGDRNILETTQKDRQEIWSYPRRTSHYLAKLEPDQMAAEKQIMVLRVRTEFRKSDVLVHYILASSNFQLAYDCVHHVKFQIGHTCINKLKKLKTYIYSKDFSFMSSIIAEKYTKGVVGMY